MNATISNFTKFFTAGYWRDWEVNPIVIKELRQGVRSLAVTGMLMLFLIVLFITSVVFLVSESVDVNVNTRLGSEMFTAFASILAGASVFLIPIYVGTRIGAERQENNVDLLYVSTLSPGRIIIGKFFCGAYMAILFFSACLPFMAFATLLRGIDLPSIFFILLQLFFAVCVATMVSIFFACLPLSRPFKILLVMLGLVGCIGMLASLIEFAVMSGGSGIGATMGGSEFWKNLGSEVAVLLMILGLLYFLAVGLISPPSANRALPIRLFMTVIWILGGLLALNWAGGSRKSDAMAAWGLPTLLLMTFALLVVVSNTDVPSRRVQRAIPENRWLRWAVFPFYNGAAGGLIWVAVIDIVTLFAIDATAPKSASNKNDLIGGLAVIAYAFAYAMTAIFIQRRMFPRRPAKLTGLLTVLLAVTAMLLPNIVLFFLNRTNWITMNSITLGNVFNIGSCPPEKYPAHLNFALGWLALATIFNLRWFMRQCAAFRPPVVYTAKDSPPVIG